jgi:peptidoglycan/LPS O-acetylase OafA/YrhL
VRVWEIDGLRAVAAWSIVVFHVWVFTSPSVLQWNLGPLTAFVSPLQSGVTLFFVLSGFLLYRPIAAALLDRKRAPDTFAYARNRALRILPAYWVILALTAFVLRSASLGMSGRGVLGGALTDTKTFVLDVLLLQTYAPHAIWTGILPAWSLTIEVAFYLVLPLLGLTVMRFAAHSSRSVAAAAGPVLAMLMLGAAGKIAVSVLGGGTGRSTSGWGGVLDRSFLTHADLFGFGMVAALLLLCWERGLGNRFKVVVGPTLSRPLAYVGLPTIFLGYYLLPTYLYDATVACLVAIVLLRLLVVHEGEERSATRGRSFLAHRWTIAAGRRSYSVFLWNYPLLTFLSAHHLFASGHGAAAFAANCVIAVPPVAGLSALTYRFVEVPALKLKRRRADVPAAPAIVPAN